MQPLGSTGLCFFYYFVDFPQNPIGFNFKLGPRRSSSLKFISAVNDVPGQFESDCRSHFVEGEGRLRVSPCRSRALENSNLILHIQGRGHG
jgi:hypothetical protein